jgi:hypothetical protein
MVTDRWENTSFSEIYALISVAETPCRYSIGEGALLQPNFFRVVLYPDPGAPGSTAFSDSIMAAQKGSGDGGWANSCFTEAPPADSPNIVTRVGSPPN